MNTQKATLAGLSAVFLWSSMVAVFRATAQSFGSTFGIALMYSLSAAVIAAMSGVPRVRALPRAYLFVGGALFAIGQMGLPFALAYATSNRQAIELGMVNYLWPGMTILFSLFFARQKANLALIIPGMLICLWGICLVLGGNAGLDVNSIVLNVMDHPFGYAVTLLGAVAWAGYCMVVIRFSNGTNALAWFFTAIAALSWVQYFMSATTQAVTVTLSGFLYLLTGAAVLAFGNTAWSIGMQHGNVTILAAASYFIPVFSAAIASVTLNTALSFSFWQGAALVCLGSILCYLAVRMKKNA